MPRSHAVVWMDFKESHVFRFGAEDVQRRRIKARNPYRKVHHKAGAIGGGHAHSDRAFFDETVDALAGTTEWLLVGPGVAKHDFLRHIGEHAPDLKAKLAAMETMDHPTDGELVAQALLLQGLRQDAAPYADAGGLKRERPCLRATAFRFEA